MLKISNIRSIICKVVYNLKLLQGGVPLNDHLHFHAPSFIPSFVMQKPRYHTCISSWLRSAKKKCKKMTARQEAVKDTCFLFCATLAIVFPFPAVIGISLQIPNILIQMHLPQTAGLMSQLNHLKLPITLYLFNCFKLEFTMMEIV